MGTQLRLLRKGVTPPIFGPCIVAKRLDGSRSATRYYRLQVEVGLGPRDIVLDGYLAPPQEKGAQPPIFGPCLLWPNGWMHQDNNWYGRRSRLRRHFVRWGPRSPKSGTAPTIRPCTLWPNGRMDQDATWYGDRPWPRPHCVRWRPSPLKRSGTAAYPNFRPVSVVAKRSLISATAEHL